MPFERQVLRTAVIAAALLTSLPALAAGDPQGVWVNDTGRGAIEIKSCGDSLCGHVVWVKDTSDAQGCGRQIIGDAKSIGDGVWGGDDAWVYSPERKKKFNVEITPQADGTLKVKGFAGVSFLSKTMVWTKAPSDLARCSEEHAATTPPEAEAAPAPTPVPENKADAPPPVEKAERKSSPAPSKPDVAEAEGEEEDVDLSELSEKIGEVFTMKDGKCKLDTPWVKLDFDCKKGEQ